MSAARVSIRLAKSSVFGCIALLWSLSGTLAHAETTNCHHLSSVPATISTSGIWCLTGNLSTAQTDGRAITIGANDVTLDLNGWKLSGSGTGPDTSAIGIFSDGDYVNVTVKDGTVAAFATGIALRGRSAVVEDVLADQNAGAGIVVSGQGAIVRNNRVRDTGGSTTHVFGIVAAGAGSLVEGNVISGLTVTASSNKYGIVLGGHSLATKNFITNTDRIFGGTTSYGIAASGTSNNVIENTVSNFNTCIYYTAYYGYPPIYAGIYARNTVTSCDTAYVGGTAGPGNAP